MSGRPVVASRRHRRAPSGDNRRDNRARCSRGDGGGCGAPKRNRPLLKIKVGAEDVVERVGAVRAAAPGARLIVDANEGWDLALLQRIGGMLAALDVEVIEQPLPASQDAYLRGFAWSSRRCAPTKSCHTVADLDRLAGRLPHGQRQARQGRRPYRGVAPGGGGAGARGWR